MSEFEGLVAIVTGGASGIGAAIALRLRNGGAQVAVLDRDVTDDGEFRADVTDDASVQAGSTPSRSGTDVSTS